MSVPFSNTHLRVPQGFGTLLEGLAREVLRDQPEDIPKYAAQYFETLLKQREDSGVDPVEWAAKLEDRFYNNHAFKTTQSQTEDELSHSEEDLNVSATQRNNSEEVNFTESTDEEEKHIMSLERRLSEEESFNRFPGADLLSDDLSETEEERDQ
uniref:RIIa domain-containing protein n=1 Tax=Anabas testudineus TaxID=64144 RepID=A0AAQ6IKS2_ANATE